MSFDLDRFKTAQDAHGTYARALGELSAGHKTSHWIWFVFPQLDGLGSSSMARRYGLHGGEEAEAYLADPVLRERLLKVVATAHRHLVGGRTRIEVLMGSQIDALKLVSSMTLFEHVARPRDARAPDRELARLATLAKEILDAAASVGYSRCRFTEARLAEDARGSK